MNPLAFQKLGVLSKVSFQLLYFTAVHREMNDIYVLQHLDTEPKTSYSSINALNTR